MTKIIITLMVVFSNTLYPFWEDWQKSFRTHLEVEDYSGDYGEKAEDIAYWSYSLNLKKEKFSHDFTVETRNGGVVPLDKRGWDGERFDYKIRYNVIGRIGIHLKLRYETRSEIQPRLDEYWQDNNTRIRMELGTDWYSILNTIGWFVYGVDIDKKESGNKTKGMYFEGDFGPQFQLTDNLAFIPTLYLNGEFYEGIYGYNMLDYQLRLMFNYKVTSTFNLLPRVRYSFYKSQYNYSVIYDDYIDAYNASGRTRLELLGTNTFTSKLSSFWGVAYDWQDRREPSGSVKEFDMFWAYFQLTYKL